MRDRVAVFAENKWSCFFPEKAGGDYICSGPFKKCQVDNNSLLGSEEDSDDINPRNARRFKRDSFVPKFKLDFAERDEPKNISYMEGTIKAASFSKIIEKLTCVPPEIGMHTNETWENRRNES
jgi:hypothetical protein